MDREKGDKKKERILLALLPFWEPQIPPLGIASLKTFLQGNGYTVKTVDANILEPFSDIHNRYFGLLEEYIPGSKRGNFHNVGHDVLRNHMMAYLHQADEQEYTRLCGSLVYQTFYTELNQPQLQCLDEVVRDFYRALEAYVFDLLAGEEPSVFGLSVFRGNLAPSLFALRLTRQHYPQIKTLMGGAVFAGELAVGSENLAYFLEKTPYIDNIFAGEGEILFLKYLQGELPPSQRVYTLEDIGGQTLDIIEELRDDIYEAWCSPFNYYKTGQVNSEHWAGRSRLLYPPGAREMLVVQTWTLEVEPSREEAFRRMNRFVVRCQELGIPNPYSLAEIYRADERWKKLHRNAVPSLVAFGDKTAYIDENKSIKRVVSARKKLANHMNFDF